MNTVYTNENPKLRQLSELLNSSKFADYLRGNVGQMTRYDWGMDRVQVSLAQETINRFLEPRGMSITTEVEHLHNIGNNNRFYVKDTSNDERFGCVCLNNDMFGRVYCYATDVDANRVSNIYHIGGYAKLEISDTFTPDWSQYPFGTGLDVSKPKEQDDFIEKEVVLRIRVPKDFDREDERMLDDAFASILENQGWELVDSKEYRKIPQYIFDDELCVQDPKLEVVDGYIWATNDLINKVNDLVSKDLSPVITETLNNFNFYVLYEPGSDDPAPIKLSCTYWYEDNDQENEGVHDIPLTPSEKKQLMADMEAYCEARYNTNCLSFLNDIRESEGLSPMEPSAHTHAPEKPSLSSQIQSAQSRANELPDTAPVKQNLPQR